MLLNCNYLTLPTITCFSFHDIYLTCHGFMGCFVLVADGRREQQRQKAHNNSTATAIIGDFETTFFLLFTKQYATCIGYHCYSSSLSRLVSKRTKKTKHVERNKRSCCDDDPPHTSRSALPLHPSVHPITCEPPA